MPGSVGEARGKSHSSPLRSSSISGCPPGPPSSDESDGEAVLPTTKGRIAVLGRSGPDE